MRMPLRAALIGAPLLLLPGVALYYTHLNIDNRLFVGKLGCGCGPFFNTNHLTWIVASVLWIGAVLFWWTASHGLSFWWRMAVFVAGFLLVGRLWFRPFLDCNLWL